MELLDSGQICNAAVVGLQRGVALPRSPVTERLAELDVLEENEVSDAEFVPGQVLLVAEIVHKLLHVAEAVVRSVRLLLFHEAELHERDEVVVSDALQLVVAGALLRRLPKQFWLEFLSDVLVHGKRLRNLEVADDQVRQVHEGEHVLLVVGPLRLAQYVSFFFKRHSGVVKQVTRWVASTSATQVPVPQNNFLADEWFRERRGLLRRVDGRGRIRELARNVSLARRSDLVHIDSFLSLLGFYISDCNGLLRVFTRVRLTATHFYFRKIN